jgi:hypothetical protein
MCLECILISPGATSEQIADLESKSRLDIPLPLKKLLKLQNGVSKLHIDSIDQMKGQLPFIHHTDTEKSDFLFSETFSFHWTSFNSVDSINFYPYIQIIYMVSNWIPIYSHNNNDEWDCLDTFSNCVIRASLLEETGSNIGYGSQTNSGIHETSNRFEFRITSQDQYLYSRNFPVVAMSFNEYLQRNLAENNDPLNLTLQQIDPISTEITQFWCNSVFDDHQEGMNLD